MTNTGGPPPRPDPLSHPREEWELAYRTLVLAPLALIDAAMPGMRERGWGRIVNIASLTVREPMPALILSNSHRAATFAAFKTIARYGRGVGRHAQQRAPGANRDRTEHPARRKP